MIFTGYLTALLIGSSLGIFGGGGSILTVPVLVYIFHIPPVVATAYSLFIVGITSLAGSVKQIKDGLVNFKIAALFFIPGITGVFLSRRFIIPAIPENIANIGNYTLTKDTAILILFSIIMVLASASMIRNKQAVNNNG